MNVGIFGGTFDPPHIGHLIAVECAREYLNLDTIRIIPANVSPHKLSKTISASAHRMVMVRLAFGGNPRFVIDEREIRREGPSFMVDTLRDLHAEFPEARFVLLLGEDNIAKFGTWREPEQVLALARVVALARSTVERSAETALTSRIERVRTPMIDISASDIRARVRQRLSIRYMVPESVQEYILREGLYVGGSEGFSH